MREPTRQQIQGTIELLRDATQAAAKSIGAAHEDIAGIPYAALRCVPLLARPADAIERTQLGITRLVYGSVAAVAGATATVATLLLRIGGDAANDPDDYSSTTWPVRADS